MAAPERKKILLRLDPAVHDALAHWAGDELRSTNSQIELLLRRALAEAGRMPGGAGRMRPRGRPPKERAPGDEEMTETTADDVVEEAAGEVIAPDGSPADGDATKTETGA